jgi:hypothetical protein
VTLLAKQFKTIAFLVNAFDKEMKGVAPQVYNGYMSAQWMDIGLRQDWDLKSNDFYKGTVLGLWNCKMQALFAAPLHAPYGHESHRA